MTRSMSAGSQLLAEPDRHREVGATQRRKAVQRLFMEHHRNAQTRVLDDPLLNGVGELRLLARRPQARSGRRAGDLARA